MNEPIQLKFWNQKKVHNLFLFKAVQFQSKAMLRLEDMSEKVCELNLYTWNYLQILYPKFQV